MKIEEHTIGGSNARLDSLAKVTGQAHYVEDIELAGVLVVRALRSPYPHARLKSIDVSRALEMPGVARVITAVDIPGLNGLDGYSREEPVLTPIGDTVRQKGTAIALIVAETPSQAECAAQAIAVEYEVLPYTYETSQSLSPDGPRIYSQGNVLNHAQVQWGDVEGQLAHSAVTLETDYHTAFQEHSALERDATLAYLEPDGRLVVIGGTHEPHWQQEYIAQTLGLDLSAVRVIMPPTGGSFGNRQDPWPLVAVGLATYLTRRPVRLAYSRREVFEATPKRHSYDAHYRIGASADGRLSGLSFHIDANSGAYDSAGYWIPNYAISAGGGPYVWQAVDAYAQSVYTNAPKCGQFRGYGTPQSTFALECSLDELCQRLGADPLDFRLKNSLPQEAQCFLGYAVGESLGFVQVLEALKPSYREYQAQADEFNAAQSDGCLRMGVGLAGMMYRFGKSGKLRIETHAEIGLDGHFIVYGSAPDYGQGISTVLVQLAAETLGLPRSQIELVNADTALTPDSFIQGGSRATYFIGSSVCAALNNLKSELFGVAAEMIGFPPDSLTLEVDRVRSVTDPSCSIDLISLAQEFERIGKSRKVAGYFDLSGVFPEKNRPEYLPLFVTGAQAAQVIVDLDTGQAKVTRMAASHDVGRAINPPGAVGQIQGALMMGIGTALREEYLPGVSSGFMDYLLPLITDVPEITVALVEVPSYYGPLGAKGLGEAAILPTAPAVINAVSRAIGARIRRLPATPERVLQAICENRTVEKKI
ncbi:MAG: xanthine dehydrogenase family protein molybdopterin-binding subunit [Anaerolineaceae bacterium]|nr:xanthine dehydrogenase family protein molybdopterin-binding subunit [Anaerolineaceae bacterium]